MENEEWVQLAERLHRRGFTVLARPLDKLQRVKIKLIRNDFKWSFVLSMLSVEDLELWCERVEDRFEKQRQRWSYSTTKPGRL